MIKRYFTIPLTSEAESFGITLAAVEYRLTLRFMPIAEQNDGQEDIAGTWLLDIATPESALPILYGLPLVAGCNLLEPFEYLNFNGELWLSKDMPATEENLGQEVELVFIVNTQGDI